MDCSERYDGPAGPLEQKVSQARMELPDRTGATAQPVRQAQAGSQGVAGQMELLEQTAMTMVQLERDRGHKVWQAP